MIINLGILKPLIFLTYFFLKLHGILKNNCTIVYTIIEQTTKVNTNEKSNYFRINVISCFSSMF